MSQNRSTLRITVTDVDIVDDDDVGLLMMNCFI